MLPLFSRLRIIKVPRCFSRRTRSLDRANMKAEEWRNMIIFYFPALIKVLREVNLEHKVLFYFVVLFRMILLPTEEFKVPNRTIDIWKRAFYKSYQRAMGEANCVFNVHIFGAHADQFRSKGPATETSCFYFEAI